MRWVFIKIIRLYQLVISPLLGDCCRFHPSCSEYAIEAVAERGVFVGLWLALKRIFKCFPWHPGGYDPVPKIEKPTDGKPSRSETVDHLTE